MVTTRTPARQRILEVAFNLFYQEGIRSVGVDKIVEQSGVGKATLYRHFPTKDDLIAAYLVEQDHQNWKHFDEAIAQRGDTPRDQLLALIDTTIDFLMEPGYRGCAFLNALAEFSEENHPAHQLAIEYNRALRLRLSRLSEQAGIKGEELTNQLLLVINGAMSSAPVMGSEVSGTQLRIIATQLIDQHLHKAQENYS